MSETATDIVTRFRRRYSQCDNATALEVLNQADEEILSYIPWRKTSRAIALVEGTQAYDLDEEEIRIWAARYYMSGTEGDHKLLYKKSFERQYEDLPTWKDNGTGEPCDYTCDVDEDQGVILLTPPPEDSSLTVSAATNATPIVVTTGTHGLSEGDIVYIQGVEGNEAANGRFYVTVPTTTTLGLYTDEDVTDAVAGTGAYTSGGVIATTDSPILIIDCTTRTVYTGSESLPITPMMRGVYVDMMCKIYSKERDINNAGRWLEISEKSLNQQQIQFWNRGNVRPNIEPMVKQKSSWR